MFAIDAAHLDLARSGSGHEPGFFVCRFFALEDRSCPFELWFGRWEHDGVLGFYVGLGGAVCDISDELDALRPGDSPLEVDDAAGTLERFLRSSVRCEFVETPRGIDEATYRASLLPAQAITSARPGRGGWLRRRAQRVVEYDPWVR